VENVSAATPTPRRVLSGSAACEDSSGPPTDACAAGCGGTTRPAHQPRPAAPPAGSRAVTVSARPAARLLPARAQALIAAETENQLLVADLPGGRVIRRIRLPDDPENVASSGKGGVVVVVSSGAGKVTLLDRDTLRPLRVLGGFASPHIPAFSPDGGHAYVTDDARGTLTAIRLSDAAVTSTVLVDAAHGYVTSASLLRGTLAVYDTRLRQLSVHRLAPTTRDLAVLP
jgi:DNA-binding beta-propeller fold protein YncE